MVAPNGARLTKADHPALPLKIDEIVTEAETCFSAGAGGLHAHVRDENGDHVLDAGLYRELLAEMSARVPKMEVQITTEAVGKYAPEQQMKVALECGANSVSVATRELAHAGGDTCLSFFRTCEARSIQVQHILYDIADCSELMAILGAEQDEAMPVRLLFVLGRYEPVDADQSRNLTEFVTWLDGFGRPADWAVCAFGPQEWRYLVQAKQMGGKCRIGFENSLYLSNGKIAPNNSAKVSDLRDALTRSQSQ